jgi:hypothetical protein
MRGHWPSFGEMATAIDYGRATVRRRETAIPTGGGHGGRPIGPKRLTACVVFATMHRGAPAEQLEATLDQILSAAWTDADIDAFLAENRQVLARRPADLDPARGIIATQSTEARERE